MNQFIQNHKTALIRTFGALFLVFGFSIHFWANNQNKGYSDVEIAAANVARMEASISGINTGTTQHAKKNSAPIFAEEYHTTREKQMRYLTIIAMILGVGLLLFSFFKKEQNHKD